MRLLTAVLIALTSPAIAAPAEVRLASFEGLGLVRFGATISELEKALNRPIQIPTDEDEKNCFFVPGDVDSTFHVMIVKGRAVRIDVDTPEIPTLRWAKVGDSIDVVRELYGRALEEEPHFYTGLPDLYLTYWSADRKYALRFETRAGKISRYYFGFAEAAQYVEGCS
jgi:hypothetical protein